MDKKHYNVYFPTDLSEWCYIQGSMIYMEEENKVLLLLFSNLLHVDTANCGWWHGDDVCIEPVGGATNQ